MGKSGYSPLYKTVRFHNLKRKTFPPFPRRNRRPPTNEQWIDRATESIGFWTMIVATRYYVSFIQSIDIEIRWEVKIAKYLKRFNRNGHSSHFPEGERISRHRIQRIKIRLIFCFSFSSFFRENREEGSSPILPKNELHSLKVAANSRRGVSTTRR